MHLALEIDDRVVGPHPRVNKKEFSHFPILKNSWHTCPSLMRWILCSFASLQSVEAANVLLWFFRRGGHSFQSFTSSRAGLFRNTEHASSANAREVDITHAPVQRWPFYSCFLFIHLGPFAILRWRCLGLPQGDTSLTPVYQCGLSNRPLSSSATGSFQNLALEALQGASPCRRSIANPQLAVYVHLRSVGSYCEM